MLDRLAPLLGPPPPTSTQTRDLQPTNMTCNRVAGSRGTANSIWPSALHQREFGLEHWKQLRGSTSPLSVTMSERIPLGGGTYKKTQGPTRNIHLALAVRSCSTIHTRLLSLLSTLRLQPCSSSLSSPSSRFPPRRPPRARSPSRTTARSPFGPRYVLNLHDLDFSTHRFLRCSLT
jgi:hypothetical protein